MTSTDTINAGDWSTTEELHSDISGYGKEDANSILVRFYNDLDVEATFELEGTTRDDATYSNGSLVGDWNRAASLQSVTIAAGGIGYVTLSEPWEVLRVGVTPSLAPSSGSATVVSNIDT